jgi:hypothetical protein
VSHRLPLIPRASYHVARLDLADPSAPAHRLADKLSPRRTVMLVSLLASVGLIACSPQSRLLHEPLPAQDAIIGSADTAPDGLLVELHQVIVRNGAGSWVRDADWDEYVVRLANHSAAPLRIERFELQSARLLGVVECSTSRTQLEKQSSATLRTLKDAGIVAGAGVVSAGAAGAAVAVVGTGSTIAASAAAAAAAIVLLPVGLVSGGVYVHKKHQRERLDHALIDEQLTQRSFALPYELAAASDVSESTFFPITPAPTRLVIGYVIAGEPHDLTLALPSLAGLHLKPTEAVRSVGRSDVAVVPTEP